MIPFSFKLIYCVCSLSFLFQVSRLLSNFVAGVGGGDQLSQKNHIQLIAGEFKKVSSHVSDILAGELGGALLST